MAMFRTWQGPYEWLMTRDDTSPPTVNCMKCGAKHRIERRPSVLQMHVNIADFCLAHMHGATPPEWAAVDDRHKAGLIKEVM